jgi:hypothetical protein
MGNSNATARALTAATARWFDETPQRFAGTARWVRTRFLPVSAPRVPARTAGWHALNCQRLVPVAVAAKEAGVAPATMAKRVRRGQVAGSVLVADRWYVAVPKSALELVA